LIRDVKKPDCSINNDCDLVGKFTPYELVEQHTIKCNLLIGINLGPTATSEVIKNNDKFARKV
jgi:hypothetical protein